MQIEAVYPDDVAAVWAELGYRLRCVKATRLLVLAQAYPKRTPGGIWIPDEARAFWAKLPNKRSNITALVLASGSTAARSVAPGQWISLPRLVYGWLVKLPGDRSVGFCEVENISGFVDRPVQGPSALDDDRLAAM